jgi:cell division initiation protein
MDRIMPIDLERPELRMKFRGYDRASVDRLINGAAKTLQEVLMENAAIRQELERLRGEVDLVRQQEQTLKDVLVVAQRAAEETRAVAHRDAETILEEARQAAMAERMSTQQKLSETRWEIEQLRANRMRYADDFRALLERHQRELGHVVGLEVVVGEGAMREAC